MAGQMAHFSKEHLLLLQSVQVEFPALYWVAYKPHSAESDKEERVP